jgi:triacylglycerol lipase
MLTTRSATRSKVSNSSTPARATKRRSLPVPLPRLQSLSSPSMATEPAQPRSPTPVIRWLGSWSQPRRAQGSGSNSPSGSAPPSPSLSLLNEALNENILPAALPQARLPSSFHASRTLCRQPPFLDNLTRSTLPTSSLSSRLPIPYDPITTQSISLDDPESSAPSAQIVFHPPGGSTSIDTLRSVRNRGMHTSASVPSPSPSKQTSRWWFQGNNKQNVDSLLEEEDRADSVDEEQSHLRKKCKFSFQII